MGDEKPRLTEVCKEFTDAVGVHADAATTRAILTACEAGMEETKDGVRKIDGKAIPRFDVNLRGIVPAAGRELDREAKSVVKAFDAECKLRGDNWAPEAAHLAVRDFLVAPLAALLGEDVPDAPAAKAKGKGKK